MPRAKRRDQNEATIIEALRAGGAFVDQLDGDGTPDLLIYYCGAWHVAEVKDGNKPPSARKLTPAQAEYHAACPGPIPILETVSDVQACLSLWQWERADVLNRTSSSRTNAGLSIRTAR